MKNLILLLLLALNPNTTFSMENWPQFLGPNRSGQVNDEKFKPWSSPLKTNWSASVGEGFGGAIIDSGEVFILDREDSESDLIKCLDFKTGKLKWAYKYKSEGRFGFNGTRSVPSTDEHSVFTIGCMGNILGINRKTGKKIWERNLIEDWQAPSPPWGFGSSPFLYKNLCIVAPLGKVGIVALSKETGETVWTSNAIGENAGYSSPVLHTLLDQTMLFQMSGDKLSAVNPDTGQEIFNWSGYNVKRAIPAPVKISDNQIFITGGYGQGSVMLKLKKDGSSITVSEEFRIKKIGSQIHAPIFKDGYIYGNFNENDNLKKRAKKQGLTCFDMKGKMMWNTGEKPNLDRGSVIMINNYLIALDGKTGELILSEANPNSYNELIRQKVFGENGDKIWAPIAYSKGKLIIRDQKEIKCLEVY